MAGTHHTRLGKISAGEPIQDEKMVFNIKKNDAIGNGNDSKLQIIKCTIYFFSSNPSMTK